MEEIAESCELSKGTIYLYFKNKEELYTSILTQINDSYHALVVKNLKKCSSFMEKFESLGQSYFEFYSKYPNKFKLINHFGEHTEKEFTNNEALDEFLASNRRIWSTLVETLEEGKRLGFFKEDLNMLEYAIMMWASSNGIFQLMTHIKNSHCISNKKEYEQAEDNFKCFNDMDYVQMLKNLWSAIHRFMLKKDFLQEIL